MKKITINEAFLYEFIKQLVINSEPSKLLHRRIQEIVVKKNLHDLQKIKENMQRKYEIKSLHNLQQKPFPLSTPEIRKPMEIQEVKEQPKPEETLPKSASPQQIQQTQTQNQPQSNLVLGRLNQLIFDPSVDSIECPGPWKNLLVSKSGAIQATSLSLSPEESKKIMEEFSRITKIPISSGVFKGAIGKLIITAVISEFVGTRFIIQKRRSN